MRLPRALGAVLIAVLWIAGAARAADFPLARDQAAVGTVGAYVIHAGDTLPDVARRFDLGFTQLQAANPGIDPWLPRVGTRIVLPTFYILPDGARTGIVINLVEQRLFYFPPDGGRVETYPIGVAVEEKSTPLGVTRVVWKEANPTWYPPASIRAEEPDLPAAIAPGPSNPLGAFALHLGWPGYLIHGTSKPDGVGRNVSHGCIRLYPEDIARLFQEVPISTEVRVVDQATEVAWIGDTLYLEVHPSKSQADQIDINAPVTPAAPEDLVARIVKATDERPGQVDWRAVQRAGLARSGLPVPVAQALKLSEN